MGATWAERFSVQNRTARLGLRVQFGGRYTNSSTNAVTITIHGRQVSSADQSLRLNDLFLGETTWIEVTEVQKYVFKTTNDAHQGAHAQGAAQLREPLHRLRRDSW